MKLIEGFKYESKKRLTIYDLENILSKPERVDFSRSEVDAINYWVLEKHIKDVRENHPKFEYSLNELENYLEFELTCKSEIYNMFIEQIAPIDKKSLEDFPFVPLPLIDLIEKKYLPIYSTVSDIEETALSYNKKCGQIGRAGIYYSNKKKDFMARTLDDEWYENHIKNEMNYWYNTLDFNCNLAIEIIVKKLIANAD